MALDRSLYSEDEPIEVDIDPNTEQDFDETTEMIDEFGWENVEAVHYFLHRHRMWKMKILRREELDSNDLVAFMLIEEEQSLKQAEQSAKLQDKNKQS